MDLIQKIRNVNLHGGHKLISLDIASMYSSVPASEAKNIIAEMLINNRTNPCISSDILNLLDVVLRHNYFTFNGRVYRQTAGLAMGSPLSPLLAEVFMFELEKSILSSALAKKHVTFWHRYVDDVLIAFDGTSRQFDLFLEHVNSFHPKIKFTHEMEVNNKISYLDLTITRKDRELQFDIYRKPSSTDTTISCDSLHPPGHKSAAFYSLYHRAFSVPLTPISLQRELETISTIAKNNGFSDQYITSVRRNVKKKLALRSLHLSQTPEDRSFKTLTYFGPQSVKIGRILNRSGLNIAYRAPTTLGRLLYNNKSKPDNTTKSGVYRLSCADCDSCYVGQTGRSFLTRKREHWRSLRLKKDDSAFASHLIATNHNPSSSLDILHLETKGSRLNVLEGMEIYKHKKDSRNLLNDQAEAFYSDFFSILPVP